MKDNAALMLSRKLRTAAEGFGMVYVGGGYGNIRDVSGGPFEFRMNFLCGGEKITIEMTGAGDFDPGPFNAPEAEKE